MNEPEAEPPSSGETGEDLDAERRRLRSERDALRAERDELAALRSRLEAERDELAARAMELDAREAELEAERERILVKEKGKLTKEGEAILDGVKKAREDLRVAQTMLKTPSPRAVKEAERKIAAVAQQVALGGALEPRRAEEPDRASVGAVTVGMKVFVPRLRTEADVIEVLANGQVRVAAGPLKLLTSVEELRQAKAARGTTPQKAAASRAEQARRASAFDAAADPEVPIQTTDNSVDLRGLRAHEAVEMAEQFLDRCVGHSLRVAFLIHGHGTGALRQAIRDAVRSSPYVERSRPGEGREGGDGVTVVWLK